MCALHAWDARDECLALGKRAPRLICLSCACCLLTKAAGQRARGTPACAAERDALNVRRDPRRAPARARSGSRPGSAPSGADPPLLVRLHECFKFYNCEGSQEPSESTKRQEHGPQVKGWATRLGNGH